VTLVPLIADSHCAQEREVVGWHSQSVCAPLTKVKQHGAIGTVQVLAASLPFGTGMQLQAAPAWMQNQPAVAGPVPAAPPLACAPPAPADAPPAAAPPAALGAPPLPTPASPPLLVPALSLPATVSLPSPPSLLPTPPVVSFEPAVELSPLSPALLLGPESELLEPQPDKDKNPRHAATHATRGLLITAVNRRSLPTRP
jgi:hypothetical protein